MNAPALDTSGFGPLLEIEGTVTTKPTVRTLPLGETGEPMPVLCLRVNGIGHSVAKSFTCNQVFPIGAHAAAHARAAQLKPGTRIKVHVALELMECHFPVTTHIGVVRNPEPQPTQEACHV